MPEKICISLEVEKKRIFDAPHHIVERAIGRTLGYATRPVQIF